jgi:hypothetical protein
MLGRLRRVKARSRQREAGRSPDNVLAGVTHGGFGVHEETDESGAVLILALVYIVAVGLIVTALATWATNDLNNTTKFSGVNTLQNAASGAVDVAIQSIRYHPLPSTTPTQKQATGAGLCWTPQTGNVSHLPFSSGLSTNPVTTTMDVWCNTYEVLSLSATRVVTFSACPNTTFGLTSGSSSTLANADGATCATSPLLQAVVSFDDYPSQGSSPLKVQCNLLGSGVSCGEGMTLESWNWSS